MNIKRKNENLGESGPSKLVRLEADANSSLYKDVQIDDELLLANENIEVVNENVDSDHSIEAVNEYVDSDHLVEVVNENVDSDNLIEVVTENVDFDNLIEVVTENVDFDHLIVEEEYDVFIESNDNGNGILVQPSEENNAKLSDNNEKMPGNRDNVKEGNEDNSDKDCISLLSDDESSIEANDVQNKKTPNTPDTNTVYLTQIIKNMPFINNPIRCRTLFPQFNDFLYGNLKIYVIKRIVSHYYLTTIFMTGKWVNDEVINIYFKLIEERSTEVLAYDTFFIPKLMRDGPMIKYKFKTVVNFFSKNKLLIPVHQENHWALFLVDLRVRKIYFYDSLNSNLQKEITALIDYLCIHYNNIHYIEMLPKEWTVVSGNSPIQNNTTDCGVFVCTNAELVSENKPLNYDQGDIHILRSKITYELICNKLIF